MLIVNQYNVIPIKEKNKKAQLDSLELSSSKVPYIRVIFSIQKILEKNKT